MARDQHEDREPPLLPARRVLGSFVLGLLIAIALQLNTPGPESVRDVVFKTSGGDAEPSDETPDYLLISHYNTIYGWPRPSFKVTRFHWRLAESHSTSNQSRKLHPDEVRRILQRNPQLTPPDSRVRQWFPWPLLRNVSTIVSAFVAIIVIETLVFNYRRRVTRRRTMGRCTRCGYSLIGLTEPRCPECGTPFEFDAT